MARLCSGIKSELKKLEKPHDNERRYRKNLDAILTSGSNIIERVMDNATRRDQMSEKKSVKNGKATKRVEQPSVEEDVEEDKNDDDNRREKIISLNAKTRNNIPTNISHGVRKKKIDTINKKHRDDKEEDNSDEERLKIESSKNIKRRKKPQSKYDDPKLKTDKPTNDIKRTHKKKQK